MAAPVEINPVARKMKVKPAKAAAAANGGPDVPAPPDEPNDEFNDDSDDDKLEKDDKSENENDSEAEDESSDESDGSFVPRPRPPRGQDPPSDSFGCWPLLWPHGPL